MTIQQNLDQVKARMVLVAQRCGRNANDITLVAVTKSQPADRLRRIIAAGATHIGENYIQEAREKIEGLHELPVQWHLIGHLQTNKSKYAVRLFDLIHTVDSLRLAAELDHQAAKIGKRQKILVQVNVSSEETKSGVSPDEAGDLVDAAVRMSHLEVMGLMTIAPYFDAPEKSRPVFSGLRQLREDIRARLHHPVALDELSMGMTGDFEVAIEEGATLVRVGTAIFGERT